jgi:hypothetical protein
MVSVRTWSCSLVAGPWLTCKSTCWIQVPILPAKKYDVGEVRPSKEVVRVESAAERSYLFSYQLNGWLRGEPYAHHKYAYSWSLSILKQGNFLEHPMTSTNFTHHELASNCYSLKYWLLCMWIMYSSYVTTLLRFTHHLITKVSLAPYIHRYCST